MNIIEEKIYSYIIFKVDSIEFVVRSYAEYLSSPTIVSVFKFFNYLKLN